MKWVVFLAAVLGLYPFGCWMRDRPRLQLRVWALLGFLPFFQPLDIGILSDLYYPGDSHGIEVALIDLLALSLFVAQNGSVRPLPFRPPMAAYLAAAVLSMAVSPWRMAAFFYVWKLLRMYFLFAVVVYAGRDREVPPAILRGMMLGVVYEFILAVGQRYLLGVDQVTGSFGHQNTLGVILTLVLMAPVALVLARKADWLTTFAPIAAMVTVVLTLSRGAIIFFSAGLILVCLLSMVKRATARKAVVALVGASIAVAVLAKAATTVSLRFEGAPVASVELRRQFESAASMMLQDNPLGVGANQFTSVLLIRGYGDRAGIDAFNKVAIVHNIYWLTAAEMGYFGIAALIALLLSPLMLAFRYGFKARNDVRGDMLLGLGVGLGILYLHGTFEWVWRTTEVSYLFWMIVAIVAAVVRQLQDTGAAAMIPKTTPRTTTYPATATPTSAGHSLLGRKE